MLYSPSEVTTEVEHDVNDELTGLAVNVLYGYTHTNRQLVTER
jgi:hypothetical protein